MLKMQNPEKYARVLAKKVARAHELRAEAMATARFEYSINQEIVQKLR